MADRNIPRVYDGIIDVDDGKELKNKLLLDRNDALFCLDSFDD